MRDQERVTGEVATDAWEALIERETARPDVRLGRALSRQGLMVHDKLYAFLRDDLLSIKLPLARVLDLVAADDGIVQLHMGQRVMKQWVGVPLRAGPSGEARWQAFADESRAHVAALAIGG